MWSPGNSSGGETYIFASSLVKIIDLLSKDSISPVLFWITAKMKTDETQLFKSSAHRLMEEKESQGPAGTTRARVKENARAPQNLQGRGLSTLN